MKNLLHFALALLIACSVLAEENASTNQWSCQNLVYGPAAICESVFLPLICGIGSTVINVDVANDDWRSALTLPYTVPASLTCGTVIGAFLAPPFLLEGIFDTLTLGYFYPEHSAWLSNYVKHSMDTVEKYDLIPNTPAEAKVVEEATKAEESK
ncbi:hypothetical protein IKW72_05290 [bacterium]|nr:hypothetical protein [bacterium]